MAFNENWREEYAKRLDKNESKQAKKFSRYLSSQYREVINIALNSKAIPNLDPFFRLNSIKELYIDLYSDIGTDFALWYEKNFEKFVKKNNRDIYKETFAAFGAKQAGAKIQIVQGTAKDKIRGEMSGLFKDPEFLAEGKDVQARILRSRFDQISQFQAERIVRTETTAAANQGIMKSAENLFDKNSLVKEWAATNDSRTRSFARGDKADHVTMDGQVKPYTEDFLVPKRNGFDLMAAPGDNRASAENVINCRCSLAIYPKEDAQLREGVELEGFGAGLGRGTVTNIPGDQEYTPPFSDPQVQELLDETLLADTVEEAAQKARNVLRSSGIDIKENIVISDKMTVEKMRSYTDEITRLANKYDLSGEKNQALKNIELKFEGSFTYHGAVWRIRGRGNKALTRIDFGVSTDKIERQLGKKSKLKDEFNMFGKSQVDEAKNEIATVTHEFAHIISKNVAPNSFADEKEKEFWKQIRRIKKSYDKERKELWEKKDAYNFNRINLGSYANKNMDEFYAEAFTEFELNSNPSKYAKIVGELIEKYFKK